MAAGARLTRRAVATSREREVARLAMQSLSMKEIAAALFIGERTVETHMASIYGKLNVRSRTDLITRFAGVLQPDES